MGSSGGQHRSSCSKFPLSSPLGASTPHNPHPPPQTEYAVTDGGGWGNVAGAVSEAAFMTGMERAGDVVTLGAYVSVPICECSYWGPV